MLSITISIIIITCLISFSAFNNEKMKSDLMFWPAEMSSGRQFYRFVTCGFVHADGIHLLFNMYSLYTLGSVTESLFKSPVLFGEYGKLFYIVLYLSAIVVSVIPDYFAHRTNYGYRALGASGAISAVVFSFIILQPALKLNFIIRIGNGFPAYIFGILFIGISIYLSKRGGDNIGHRAHLSGALYGLLFTIIVPKFVSGFDVIDNFIRMVF